ncbi:MAG: GGDEF domain-containing protein [Chloroflexi bacterium]|nr:GGDEF domain-containing protein [Chloroflexota bacterium]
MIAGAATLGFLGATLLSGITGAAFVSVTWWGNAIAVWIVAATAGLVGIEVNRTHRRMAEQMERSELYSNVDWLTGLYNRRHLEFVLPQEIARAHRNGRPVSLLIVDADHLKAVNDNLGHLMGDQLLTHISEVMKLQMRLVDTVIRFGGDEFVIIMPDTDSAGAFIPSERIRAVMSGYELSADGIAVETSISAGLVTFPEDAQDGSSLLAAADSALYVSKRDGRDRVTVYRPEYSGVTEPVGRD